MIYNMIHIGSSGVSDYWRIDLMIPSDLRERISLFRTKIMEQSIGQSGLSAGIFFIFRATNSNLSLYYIQMHP